MHDIKRPIPSGVLPDRAEARKHPDTADSNAWPAGVVDGPLPKSLPKQASTGSWRQAEEKEREQNGMGWMGWERKGRDGKRERKRKEKKKSKEKKEPPNKTKRR